MVVKRHVWSHDEWWAARRGIDGTSQIYDVASSLQRLADKYNHCEISE